MKYFLLINLLVVAMIYGCRGFSPVASKEFIPGTYIRFSAHEFGFEYDTMMISLQLQSVNQYRIVRRWKYRRVGEGEEYKVLETAGVYDDVDRVLEDMDTGDRLSFDQKALFIGSTKYIRL